MPCSVLGKRTRSVTESSGKSSRKERGRKRTQFVVGNDENENPFITRQTRSSARLGHDDAPSDAPSDGFQSAGKENNLSCSVPAKHGAFESRVALTPGKINSHFKSTKFLTTSGAKSVRTTSQTPTRYHDALLADTSVTPKRRVGLSGKSLTPRKSQTPATPKTAPSVYNEARQLFSQTVLATDLVGRESEKDELEVFVMDRVESMSSGCIYISGPPGTGKSALVSQITRQFEGMKVVKSAYLNCMSIKSGADIYTTLLDDFGCDATGLEASPMETLREVFFKRESVYLVTLDEIDHILDLDLDCLYKIFEWSLLPSNSLALVGIANALDFTDRFLPRLKSRGLKPQLLPFMPYSAAQVGRIITSKLKSLLPFGSTAPRDFTPFIHPTAVQFLSKKVAAQTGDLRKAFDIARRAIDLVETEARDKQARDATTQQPPTPTPSPSKTPLIANMNLSSPPGAHSPIKTPSRKTPLTSALGDLTIETAPRATISHIARITATVFGNGAQQRLLGLNLQQKAVLCALRALENKKKETAHHQQRQRIATHAATAAVVAPTIRELYNAYSSLCRHEDIFHPLSATEFRDVVASLETLSLVAMVEGKGGSFATPTTPSKRGRAKGGFATSIIEERRVASAVGAGELETALNGVGGRILKRILIGAGLDEL
ncbi:P-loop containing nucleoside triphosphate hydrolase protein [Lineolata rhizophorae]|uniref:Cell division control protein n=1 Tax=Lineolata rhizophorae TaxID=578093 RepID=A0A6A6NY10_9PEZI|nr:P-loop containing nucleoside triphosphate hydrolase protein [Lineolata rhizophorae]